MPADFTSLPQQPVWRDSDSVCGLSDQERHLGHILKIDGRWHAFDGTHFNGESNGFRSLGSFASLTTAKEAVEAVAGREIARRAAA
jgi:hypothetical protein